MLIFTKLQRPETDPDFIARPHLITRLNHGLHRKLTLISAQAGSGKTTLMAQWLAQSQCPNAWLSLDAHDNDLMLFVGYLCEAVRTAYPNACNEVVALLNASQPPPSRILLSTFVNQLTALFQDQPKAEAHPATARRLTIVLDDYHHITAPVVHAFVADFLAYLPRQVHLALATRIDPPLPLARLRARRELSELRTTDLRFSAQEAERLLTLTMGRQLNRATVDLLEEATEGWAVGLRLAGLSLRHTPNFARHAAQFTETSSAVIVDYLAGEVLDHQAPEVRDFLLSTSILERFNVDLCAALLHDGAQAHELLREVKQANLFLVPLDPAMSWFRYHHLFGDLLQALLQRERTPAEINDLHARASRWLAENGLVDEALSHAFAAGDIDAAVRIVADQRYALMNQEQWRRLGRLLDYFVPETIAQQPQLLMLETWLLYHGGHHDRLPTAVRAVEECLASTDLSPREARHLQGELNALTGFLAVIQTDLMQATAASEFAIAQTPPELWIVRSFAHLVLAAARQMQGDDQSVYDFIAQSIRSDSADSDSRKATTFMQACPLFWLAGDLEQMKRTAEQCLAFCSYPNATQTEGFARYHLGRAAYYQNDLAAAEEHLGAVIGRPYHNYGMAYANAAYGLALTHLAQDRSEEGDAILADASAFASESGNATLLALTLAIRADIALRQGDMNSAGQWAAGFDPLPPLVLMPNFCRPLITLAKMRLAVDTPSSRRQAAALLDALQTSSESTRQVTVLIEVLALQALRHAARGDERQALDLLAQAVTLAQPGGIVRIFADLGAPMRRLLHKLADRVDAPEFLERLLHAFRRPSPDGRHNGAGHAPTGFSFPDPLTPREMDVLALLAKRLTNGEIAIKLVIAPGTVKTHTLNIYAKLAVHDRRAAVLRARELGLIDA